MPNPEDSKTGDSTALKGKRGLERLVKATGYSRDGLVAEINPLGKRAKDYGSAAVMISLLFAALTWITILGSHYL